MVGVIVGVVGVVVVVAGFGVVFAIVVVGVIVLDLLLCLLLIVCISNTLPQATNKHPNSHEQHRGRTQQQKQDFVHPETATTSMKFASPGRKAGFCPPPTPECEHHFLSQARAWPGPWPGACPGARPDPRSGQAQALPGPCGPRTTTGGVYRREEALYKQVFAGRS